MFKISPAKLEDPFQPVVKPYSILYSKDGRMADISPGDAHNQLGKPLPERLRLAPHETKSEPGSPVYCTVTNEIEAPNDWFDYPTYKEKLAIMTMESIPNILHDEEKDFTKSVKPDHFSPRLLPLLDRMKFHFSRTMALARHEAECGHFEWPGSPSKRPDEPILPCDVLSGPNCEIFLAGIEEVRRTDKKKEILYRRYWRLLERPEGLKQQVGGVISSSSHERVHVKGAVADLTKKNWDSMPKQLLGEFAVGPDGCSFMGRMLSCDLELEE